MKTVLITGSRGFIGSHLTEALELHRDTTVVGYDLLDGLDVRDGDLFRRVCEEVQPSVIVHLAAYHPLSWGERSPLEDAHTNILGALNVLEHGGAPVIYSSTGSVYGNLDTQPVNEFAHTTPESFYGVSKYCAEQYFEHYAQKREGKSIIFRFSSVYGPRRIEGPINQMLERTLQGEFVPVYGTGEITRDYTYIIDIVAALLMAINGVFPWNETYNIGSGVETSVNQVVAAIREVTGENPAVQYLPERVGDITRNYFDIGKAQACGYLPRTPLKEGIEQLYDYMRG